MKARVSWRRTRLAAWALGGLFPLMSGAEEVLLWDNQPLTITLQPGQERMIRFPDRIRLNVPAQLNGSLRTQVVDNRVYWLASRPFDRTRVVVMEEAGASPAVYLLDVLAADTGGGGSARILHSARTAEMQREEQWGDSRNPPELLLTRFAAQSLFAPRRLIPHSAVIHRWPTPLSPVQVPLVRGIWADQEVLAAWHGHGLFVTAVALRHLGGMTVSLDPSRVRGRWRAVSFHHRQLGPSDGPLATTVLYLVSDKPFPAGLGSR